MFVVDVIIIVVMMLLSVTIMVMMNPTQVVTAYVVVSPIWSSSSSSVYQYRDLPTTITYSHRSTDDGDSNGDKNLDMARDCHRRSILHQMTTWGSATLISTTTTTTATTILSVQPVNAIGGDNRLFQSNTILTNPILEQLRIWEQAEADNIKYNGELERGDAGNRGQINAYPSLLLPILSISQDISYLYLNVLGTNINNTLSSSSSTAKTMKDSYQQALQILSNRTTYDTINFKRIFNAYADNVYYSDPDRANLYLGGGATPKSIQSLAYLLRNEILDNLDNLRAELQYQLHSGQPPPSSASPVDSNDDENEEVRQLISAAYTAMQKYLEIIPPNELQSAITLMQQK